MQRRTAGLVTAAIAGALALSSCSVLPVVGSVSRGSESQDQSSQSLGSSAPNISTGGAFKTEILSPEQQAEFGPLAVEDVEAPENRDLSEAQVDERLAEIDSTYTVGEVFSAKDQEFIRAYATPETEAFEGTGEANIVTVDSMNYSKTGGSGTKSCKISGKMTHNQVGALNWTWSATSNLSTGAAITKTKVAAHARGYGLIGSSGIGLVYSADPSDTTTAHTYAFSRKATYTALLAYYTIYVSADCYYKGGSFTVSSAS